MIWSNEEKYNKIIDGMALGYGVPTPLIKGIIAKESSFNPTVSKDEPQIQDKSRGLMQVLFKTAQNLGHNGTPDDLFKPDVNIMLGTKLLAENLQRTKGNVEAAVAAYNAGWRWWNKKLPIPNLDYVNDVKVYTSYFAKKLPESDVLMYIKSKKTGRVLPGGATTFFYLSELLPPSHGCCSDERGKA